MSPEISQADEIQQHLDGLLAFIAAPGLAAFDQIWLIIPQQGLQDWLISQISQQLGICSGIRFFKPQEFCEECLRLTAAQARWPSPQQTVWYLLTALQRLPAEDASFALLKDYLAESADDKALRRSRLWNLAAEIAELFEQYALFGPQLLSQWSKALPPLSQAQARWQAWLWQQLPPCFDIPAQLAALKQLERADLPARLASFGLRQHSVLLSPLLEACLETLDPLLPLRRFELSPAAFKSELAKARLSLNSLASPLRELEALKDWLLTQFEAQPDLGPQDIALLSPEPEVYQALLPLVFEQSADQAGFTVRNLGQTLRQSSALPLLLEQLLELPSGRLGLSSVLQLLKQPLVASKFRLDSEQLELCQHWLQAVNIRWGWDARERQRNTAVAFAENSWQSGIKRLLLGYMLPLTDQGRLYHGVSAYTQLEGSQGQVLARLLQFLEQLEQQRRALQAERPLAQWVQAIRELLQALIALEHLPESERQLLEDSLTQLQLEPSSEPLPLSWVRRCLVRALGQSQPQGQPDGRMVCASFEQMQGVPLRMVAILGLHDRFPRQALYPELDLLRHASNNPHLRDRELWYSALAAASDAIWVSYLGQDPFEGRSRYPSLLISELQAVWPHWQKEPAVQSHPLHPYAILTGQQSLSYQPTALELSEILNQPRQALNFSQRGLPASSEQLWELAEFQSFWLNPGRAFLKARLNLSYLQPAEAAGEAEALELDGLGRYGIEQELLSLRQEVSESAQARQLMEQHYQGLVAESRLPVGGLGRIRFEEAANEADFYWQRLQEFLGSQPAQDLPFELPGLGLKGQLRLWPEGQKFERLGKLRPQDLLRAWLAHLVLQLLDLPEQQRQSWILSKDKKLVLAPEARAALILEQLVAASRQGLERALAFFPETSLAYAEAIHKGKSRQLALQAAETAWKGGFGQQADGARAEWQVCFGTLTPQELFDERFCQLAEEIWLPLLEALHEL